MEPAVYEVPPQCGTCGTQMVFQMCDTCRGVGWVYIDPDDDYSDDFCPECLGDGGQWVCPDA